jgi:NitT/TauT family transport system substrate-binding protein
MTTRRDFLVSTAALAAAPLAPVGRAVAQPALEEVTYLLPAPAQQVAFAPWLLAQARGYYAAEGLKVTFQPGRGGVDAAKQVGAGNAPVCGAFGDTPIIVRAQGVPVKAVAVLGGRSMTTVAVHEDSGITSPAGLKGKTITAMTYADSGYFALLAMLASAGLTKNDVNAQAAGPAGVWQLFTSRKADAMTAVPEWIADARGAGAKMRLMPAYEYTKSMAQAILASDEVIQKRPELVRKIVRATLHGMRDIMTDPKAAVRDYVNAMPAHKGREAYVEETFGLYNTLVYPGQKTLGMMDPERLAELQRFYVKEGIVPKESALADLYTNEFVS